MVSRSADERPDLDIEMQVGIVSLKAVAVVSDDL